MSKYKKSKKYIYTLIKIREFVISLLHYIVWFLLMLFIFLSCRDDSGP